MIINSINVTIHYLNNEYTEYSKNNGNAIFNIQALNDYNEYEIECDNENTGTYSNNQLVINDIVDDTECTLKLKLYLYKDGNEYSSITGGWIRYGYNIGTFVKNSTNIYMNASGNNKNTNSCGTSNMIDVTGYSNFFAELKIDNNYFASNIYYTWWRIDISTTRFNGVYTSYSDQEGRLKFNFPENYKNIVKKYNVNIENFNEPIYPNFIYASWGNGGTYNMTIYKVWLE